MWYDVYGKYYEKLRVFYLSGDKKESICIKRGICFLLLKLNCLSVICI